MEDHLKLTDTHLLCTDCNGKKAYTRPITIQRLSALAQGFGRLHARCGKGAQNG